MKLLAVYVLCRFWRQRGRRGVACAQTRFYLSEYRAL